MARRIKVGDIVEIPTRKGLAYGQLSHKHPHFGALLRVLPGFYEIRPVDFETIVDTIPQFWTFFPLQIAINQGMFAIVANVDVPLNARDFPLFRAAGHVDREGRVQSWWLWDGEDEWQIGELTMEQRHLPIRAVWNDTLLIERIEKGWTAENDF